MCPIRLLLYNNWPARLRRTIKQHIAHFHLLMIPALFAKVRAIYAPMFPMDIPILASLLLVNAKKLKEKKRDACSWKRYPTLVHFVTRVSKTLNSPVHILKCKRLLKPPMSLLRIPMDGSFSSVQMVVEKLTWQPRLPISTSIMVPSCSSQLFLSSSLICVQPL